jgi:AraC-like DNA-binding protein
LSDAAFLSIVRRLARDSPALLAGASIIEPERLDSLPRRLMPSPPSFDLHLRSYGEEYAPDRHSYAQLVLPVSGGFLIEIEGRERPLDSLHGALVAPGALHSQYGEQQNQSIILDIGAPAFADGPWQRLLDQPFTQLGPAARKLVEFMAILARQQAAPPGMLQGWAPLLLDTLSLAPARPASRLAALLARVQAELALPWSTGTMAASAGMSVSRLHALFRAELDTSPHEWLLRRRLELACDWLAGSRRSIADIALASGFSDQSALTRAMRATFGTTPAAWRREAQEKMPTTR